VFFTKTSIVRCEVKRGSWFERYVAKKLHAATGLDFVRVPLSGASWLKGDVICLQDQELRIEVKYRKRLKESQMKRFMREYPEEVLLICGMPWMCKTPFSKEIVSFMEVVEWFLRRKNGRDGS